MKNCNKTRLIAIDETDATYGSAPPNYGGGYDHHYSNGISGSNMPSNAGGSDVRFSNGTYGHHIRGMGAGPRLAAIGWALTATSREVRVLSTCSPATIKLSTDSFSSPSNQ